MQFSIHTLPDTDIAFFKRSGKVDLDDRKENRKLIQDYCKENGLRKVIIDAREQESSLSLVDGFNFGVETAVMMKKMSIAVLYEAGDESIIYIINSASSRGMNIKAFTDMGEAVNWLS